MKKYSSKIIFFDWPWISDFNGDFWKPAKQIEALRGQRAANENEMSDMHVSFRKYANERKIARSLNITKMKW